MVYLTSILKSIDIICESAITTNQLDFTLSYTEKIQGVFIPKTITGTTNGSSSVVMLLASQVNNIIEVTGISVINNDSAANTITISLVKTQGGYTILKKVLLDVGEQLDYDGTQWHVMTPTGEIKTGSGGGGMVYPGIGIAVSTGSSWNTSISNNSTNWNEAYSWVNTNGANAVTAYGWGNHASAGYLTSVTSLQVTTALGYTPYNSTNPSGYITASSSSALTNKTGNISQWTNDSGYITLSSLSSYVPTSRSITINGTAYDLSADRTWTIAADSLSSLTAATTSATINSAANAVDWQWNSITSGIGFKISSTSTAAASNTQTLFNVALSGANATSTQTTRAGIFSNTHTGTSSTNIALQLTASGGSTNTALDVTAGDIQLVSNSWVNFLSNTQRIGSLSGFLQYQAGTSQHIMISTNTSPLCVVASTGGGYFTIAKPTSTTNALIFNGDYTSGNYRGELTYSNVIKTANGVLDICANTNQSGAFASFTPNVVVSVKPTGVLNIKPITATAASAITPAEGDIVMVSSTNGTFATIGLYGYQNGAWTKM